MSTDLSVIFKVFWDIPQKRFMQWWIFVVIIEKRNAIEKKSLRTEKKI